MVIQLWVEKLNILLVDLKLHLSEEQGVWHVTIGNKNTSGLWLCMLLINSCIRTSLRSAPDCFIGYGVC